MKRKPYPTGIKALDEMLSGGVALGTTLILAGPPSSGRTTLAAQIADGFAKNGLKSYYARGEHFPAMSAYFKRLGIDGQQVIVHSDPENDLELYKLLDDVAESGAKLLVIDSAQTCTIDDVTDFGHALESIVVMLECFASRYQIAVILLWHTEDGLAQNITEKIVSRADGGVLYVDVVDGRLSTKRRLRWERPPRWTWPNKLECTIELNPDNGRFV